LKYGNGIIGQQDKAGRVEIFSLLLVRLIVGGDRLGSLRAKSPDSLLDFINDAAGLLAFAQAGSNVSESLGRRAFRSPLERAISGAYPGKRAGGGIAGHLNRLP